MNRRLAAGLLHLQFAGAALGAAGDRARLAQRRDHGPAGPQAVAIVLLLQSEHAGHTRAAPVEPAYDEAGHEPQELLARRPGAQSPQMTGLVIIDRHAQRLEVELERDLRMKV